MILRDERFLRNIRNFIVSNKENAPLGIDYYLDTIVICPIDELGSKLLSLDDVVGIKLDECGKTKFTLSTNNRGLDA